MITTSNTTKKTPVADPIFDDHMRTMQARLARMLARGDRLFTTDAEDLFAAYLAAFPEHLQQHHNCNACRHFVERFGGLVTIDERGVATSALWHDDAPYPYDEPLRAMRAHVEAAKVTGVFYSEETLLGFPTENGWTHFEVTLPVSYTRLHSKVLTPSQASAEKSEDFKNVLRAVAEFRPEALAQVISLLESDTLYRSEKLLGAAKWLADFQSMRRDTKNKRARENLSWRAVAAAPAGFCHPRSGMLSTLLDDLTAGLSFAEVKRRFDEKMHPLQYQRPQAAPKAGAIEQAEKLVEKLGIANSLKRRYARLDEIEAIWLPHRAPPEQPAAGRVFAHLAPKGARPVLPELTIPEVTMTWVKFRELALANAEAIEFFVPYGHDHYCQFTTATDPLAPPILQWDTPENRNPVAWYIYQGGSAPAMFNLQASTWTKVTAVAFQPTMWRGGSGTHHGESVIFTLEDCKDTVRRGGMGLFPECMKSELHGVRSVIEAHSQSAPPDEVEGPVAAGFRLQKGQSYSNARFRVHLRGMSGWRIHRIDRWD